MKKIIVFILVIAFVIGSIFWLILGGTKVKAYKIEKQNAIKGVTVTGTVQSQNDILVGSSVTAKIIDIKFQEGYFVKKGQILALLDNKDAQGNVISAEGQLETARAQVKNLETEPRIQSVAIAHAQVNELRQNIDIQRQELRKSQIQLQDALSDETRLAKLYQQGAVSFRDYEKASFARAETERTVNTTRSQIKAAQARLNQSQQNLNLILAGTKPEQIQAAQGQVQATRGGVISAVGRFEDYTIRAPITGYIVTKILDKGEVSSPSSPVLRIVRPEDIYINAQVEENELKNVKIGQNTYIVFDAYPGMSFHSKVIEIIKTVDPVTGTFIAKVAVPKYQNKPVLVGMTSDVSIIVKSLKNVIIIPNEFISTKNKQQFVYRDINGKAAKTYIESINFDNNKAYVTKGLKPGDIVVKGLNNSKLKPNTRIKTEQYYRD